MILDRELIKAAHLKHQRCIEIHASHHVTHVIPVGMKERSQKVQAAGSTEGCCVSGIWEKLVKLTQNTSCSLSLK